MKSAPYKIVTALDVCENDIIYNQGFRCRVTEVVHAEGVARYTLHSEPSESHPEPLPRGYEGMRAGGNALARVGVEIA